MRPPTARATRVQDGRARRARPTGVGAVACHGLRTERVHRTGGTGGGCQLRLRGDERPFPSTPLLDLKRLRPDHLACLTRHFGKRRDVPAIRHRPAIIAQVRRSSSSAWDPGECLNQNVVGRGFPDAVNVRHTMPREALEIIRLLWRGGCRSYEETAGPCPGLRVFRGPAMGQLVSGLGMAFTLCRRHDLWGWCSPGLGGAVGDADQRSGRTRSGAMPDGSRVARSAQRGGARCAVRRFVVSPTQSGRTWRDVLESPGSPGRESARGQQHAREAGAVWRRPGHCPARLVRYGQSWIA